jgi:ABC-2 type transport system permease protein
MIQDPASPAAGGQARTDPGRAAPDSPEVPAAADLAGPGPWARPLRRLVLNPLIVKDGLSRMRSWRAPAAIGAYLGLLGLFATLVLSLQLATVPRAWGYAQVGSVVFTALALVQLALVCLYTPAVAAGAISGERERQTLDVLLVSCASSFSIVWGKLVASVAFVVVLILAALPIFATVFLFGGIDASQFAIVQLLTMTTALATAAVSLFLSSLLRRTLAATVLAYALTFAATAGGWLVGTILNQIASAPSVPRGAPSPAGPSAAYPLLYLNPIHAMTSALQGGAAIPLGRAGQLFFLLAGPPSTTGPPVEPWQITMLAQLVLVTVAVLGAVQLLRANRVFAARRGG